MRGKGEGSVYYAEREDRWVAQIEDGYTASGQRRYRRRYRPNRRQALDALAQLQREVGRNIDPTAGRQTLAAYLDRWLDGLDGNRAEGTIAAYRAETAHAKAVIGQVRLDKLAPDHVRQLMAALPKRGLAPKTALNVRTTLHTAVEQAVRDRVLDWNPVSVVDRPKVERHDMVPLTVDQAREVLAALADDRLYALYAVGVAVGLRMGEALGLTWPRVDLDQGVIQVRQQLRRTGEPGDRHYVLRDLKSKKSRRDIPLPAFAVDGLRAHKAAQAVEKMANRDRWVDGCCTGCGRTGLGLVFATCSVKSAGRPIHPSQALKHFQAVCDVAIGLRPRYHDLRHTAATLLLAQRVPLAEIQQILGHSSIQVTKDVYSHLEVEHLRRAAGEMDQLLG